MSGIFTISLDYELHWGVFDKKNREERETIYRNTHALVPRMLELFAEYEVHATWATVGSLMAEDHREWNAWKPALTPDYKWNKYSAYVWVEEHGMGERNQWAHFAPETIPQILATAGQELGTHTFSHFYCLEEQNEAGAFSADLAAAVQAARKFGSRPVSLVFPRNQFNPEYLVDCYRHGIRVVRTNPPNWFWVPAKENGSNIFRKIVRAAQAYINFSGQRTSYPLSDIVISEDKPILVPFSQFLRPWSPKFRIGNSLRLRRICREITSAAVHDECFHLWWHPENFGEFPEQNLRTLRLLLKHFRKCRDKYGMQSWNMGEFASNLGRRPEHREIKVELPA